MNLDFLKNKKIAVIGFGAEGRSLLNFFARHGLTADLLDERTEAPENLPPSVGRTIFGPKYLDELGGYDLIFRSPGISPLKPQIQRAKAGGAEVSSLTKLFFRLCPCPIIGVTGTKGKGTTATLIREILETGGKEVFLGGNIGGSPLDFIDQTHEKSYVVLELSSFQLQDMDTSPQYAVVLNITSDHLDYHKDVAEYVAAKANIVSHQKPQDKAILFADGEVPKSFAFKTPAAKYWFSTQAVTEPGAFLSNGTLYLKLNREETEICQESELNLRGRHNVKNVLAAALTAALAGIDSKAISRAVKEYRGMDHHRLEFVEEIEGVEYFNDSASTLPDAAIAAARAFSAPKILILGGSDKGADYSELGRELAAQEVKAVILTGLTAGKIRSALSSAGFHGEIIKGIKTMDEIVKKAAAIARPGDVVLLSPASASFGMFKNYQDRGSQFIAAVKKLENKK